MVEHSTAKNELEAQRQIADATNRIATELEVINKNLERIILALSGIRGSPLR